MKIRELKVLVREKLSSGLTKQETFDLIVSMNVIRIHDVACAVRDVASNFYKSKYKNLNRLLVAFIVIVGLLQATLSLVFSKTITNQMLSSDMFLMLTYVAIAVGIYFHYKMSFSAVIFLSIISIYMSVQSILANPNEISLLLYYLAIATINLAIIAISAHLYSKYFRGFDIKQTSLGESDSQSEYYFFKEES